MAHLVRSAQVGAERRLAIGAGRNKVEGPAAAEDGGKGAGDGVETLTFERQGRHRDAAGP